MKQTISEIIDQRLDQQALEDELCRVARDSDACVSWRNYHLIGDVIRGEVGGGTCLINRVQGALDREPTVFTPSRRTRPAVSSASSGMASDAARSAGLFAIAASLALVAVLTLSPITDEAQRPAGPGENDGIATVEATGLDSRVATTTGTTPSQQTSGGARSEGFESEFGQMLVEHGEFTATSGLNGLITYAKLVSNQQLGE